jgi:hypothetical protein
MLFIRFLNLLNIAFVVNKGTIKNNIHVHMKRHWTTHTLKKENMNNHLPNCDANVVVKATNLIYTINFDACSGFRVDNPSQIISKSLFTFNTMKIYHTICILNFMQVSCLLRNFFLTSFMRLCIKMSLWLHERSFSKWQHVKTYGKNITCKFEFFISSGKIFYLRCQKAFQQ